MQYPVIYVVVLHLNRYNSFSRYRARLTYSDGRSNQKIDDLPVLVTYRSRTSAMLSSKVNGPVAHENTW